MDLVTRDYFHDSAFQTVSLNNECSGSCELKEFYIEIVNLLNKDKILVYEREQEHYLSMDFSGTQTKW